MNGSIVNVATIASTSPNVTKPDSEQRCRTDSERAGEPGDNEVARIRRPAFDAPDVVLVDGGEFRESFLRVAAIVPQVADSLPEGAEYGSVRGHEDATEETLLCCRMTDSMLSLP